VRGIQHSLDSTNRRVGRAADSSAGPTLTAGTYGKYMAAVALSVACCLVLYYASLLTLKLTGNLPPPALANNLCTDEKLSFMRDNPSLSPNLLAIGSSVTLRHLDGATIARLSPGTKLLNGGFCGLSASQSVFVANWLLDRHPTIQNVVMVLAPQDLAGCRAKSEALFNRSDVDDFVYDGKSLWGYYLRYFAPRSLLRSAQTIKAQRAGLIPFESLVFTGYGDSLLTTELTREMSYGPPPAMEKPCLEAIRSLGTRLRSEGRNLTLVTTPLHPEWQAQVRHAGPYLDQFDKSLLALQSATGARYWNAAAEWQAPRASFTDAIHLRSSAAQEFSAELSRRLLQGARMADKGLTKP